MNVYVLLCMCVHAVGISSKVHSRRLLEHIYSPQTVQWRDNALQQPSSSAVGDKMVYVESKHAQRFNGIEIDQQRLSKKRPAMLSAHMRHYVDAFRHLELNRKNNETISEGNKQKEQMESMKRIGRTAEQEATTILNEQDAIILYENSAQQTAHILTLPLRTDSTTSTEEAVLAPVAKRLPPIFAGSLSPDTGRTIPQFSGEEVISPNNCEAVDIVLANGNNSIFLQTLRKASKQLETREKISLNSLADRIYGTVLGNRSIDDYDKFVRLKIILIEYIGTNEQRARKLLPLRIPQFGALQQLLACR